MKSSAFRFTLLLVLVLAVVHFTVGEYCPKENCVPAEQCEHLIENNVCDNGNRCCSVVKSAFRTHCNHFGGICMDNCNQKLQREAVDCPQSQRCCVLV